MTGIVDPGGLQRYGALEAVTFTPTLYQNGVLLATSEAIGEYWIRGDHCDLWMSLTANAVGTGSTFIEIKSIPAAITPVHFSGTRGKYMHGVASYHTVANTSHQGVGQFNTATGMGFLMDDNVGNWFGITPIIAVAVGEVLSFTGSYRRAA